MTLRALPFAALALALSAGTAFGSGWSQPEPLSLPGEAAGPPAIATGDTGAGLGAWPQGGALTSAERAPATPWGLPESGPAGVTADVALATIGEGATLAVWATATGPASAIRLSGEPWGAPQLLDADGPAPVGLRLASNGEDAVAVWSSGAGEGTRASSFVDGDWSDVTVLSGEAPGADPAVDLDDDGRALAVWRSAANQLAAAERNAGGEWSEPESVTTAGVSGRTAAEIVIGSDGGAVATWREPGQIAAAQRADDGSWAAPVRVSSASRPSAPVAAGRAPRLIGPQIAADGTGLSVAWSELSTGRLLVRTRSDAGIWGAIRPLSPSRENAREPRVAVDDDGNLLVAWIQGSGTGTRVRAAQRPAGEDFTAPVNLSRRQGEVHDLAMSAAVDGGALAAWLRDTSSGTFVVAARARTETACAIVPMQAYPAPSKSTAKFSARQLGINQRISQAAVRRAAAIERWFDDGIVSSDICGAGLDHNDLGPGITRVFAGVPVTQAVFPIATPRPLEVAPAAQGSGQVTLDARQLRINQRISQAAVRRINALTKRLDGGLTGGDLADGAVGTPQIDPVVSVISSIPEDSPDGPSITDTAPASGGNATIRLNAAQLRTNQRISQAAVRRANELLDRIATGLTSADFADGSVSAADLAPGVGS